MCNRKQCSVFVFQQTEVSESCIMSSCVKPQIRSEINPIVLLHSFDRFVICAISIVVVTILVFC